MASVLPKSLENQHLAIEPLSTSERPLAIENTLPAKIAFTIAATGLVALSAHVSFLLPFTAVPLTLQTFAVILVGMLLGPIAGFFALALYLAEGAAGLPVFSPHGPGGIAQLLSPTAGFLFSYPLAAAVAGLFARKLRLTNSSFRNGLIAGVIASLPIFLLGGAWYAFQFRLPATAVWHLAVAPFLPGEIVKIISAAGIFSSLYRWRQSAHSA
jgi:biotin transport system substrate-specific component